MRSAILDLTVIRRALAAAAENVGLRAYAYPADQPAIGPAGTLIVDEAEDGEGVSYHQDGDGLAIVRLTLLVLIGSAGKAQAVETIDGYRGRGTPTSLLSAIEGDPSLGGCCDAATIVAAGPVHLVTYGDVPYWGAEWVVEVMG